MNYSAAMPRPRRSRQSAKPSKARMSHRRSLLPWSWVHLISKGGNASMLTRRVFLRGSAIVAAGMGVAPGWLARAVASEGRKRKTLVAIFMRGAADGLSIVAPFADKRYHEVRPTIAVAPPSGQNNAGFPAGVINGGSIDLDGTFALNGAMQPMKGL